jgi:hypothetical protein
MPLDTLPVFEPEQDFRPGKGIKAVELAEIKLRGTNPVLKFVYGIGDEAVYHGIEVAKVERDAVFMKGLDGVYRKDIVSYKTVFEFERET